VINLVFSTLYPVERGMRDSTPKSLERLLGQYGTAELSFLEASSLVRALGFVIGWPTGPRHALATTAFRAATLWETTVGWLLPRRRWVYMLAEVRKSADP
jgi:hypothetical protein